MLVTYVKGTWSNTDVTLTIHTKNTIDLAVESNKVLR